MGFLARRTLTPPAPVAAAGSPAPLAGPARLNWQHDRPFGWAALPEPARAALAAAGWATGDALAAWSYAPTTRRDPDGRYWCDTDAWWIDQDTLLLVRAREALTQRGTGPDGRPRLRRRRRTRGTVQVTTHRLTGPVPTGQRWQRPQRPTGPGAGSGGVRVTDTAIELLPRAVQDELGHPTGQGAIRSYPSHGGFYDRVYAYRRDSPTGGLLMVAAARQAGPYPDPDTAIEAADWHITTYRPHVGAPSTSALAM